MSSRSEDVPSFLLPVRLDSEEWKTAPHGHIHQSRDRGRHTHRQTDGRKETKSRVGETKVVIGSVDSPRGGPVGLWLTEGRGGLVDSDVKQHSAIR